MINRLFYTQKRKFQLQFKFFVFYCRNIWINFFSRKINSHLINQQKNYKHIPIIIINYNRVTFLKNLISYLFDNGYTNIVIIDNNSTFPPLLDYYKEIQNKVKIHQLNKNHGHKVFWEVPEIYNKYKNGYFVITDSDIVPKKNCPDNFVKIFMKILNSNYRINKVGFSLQIDDLPVNKITTKIKLWESQFWQKKIKNDYEASIDTTFALYRPHSRYIHPDIFFKAIRTDSPYTAKHLPWYVDYSKMSEEEKYYQKAATQSSSWRVDDEGNIKTERYQKL